MRRIRTVTRVEHASAKKRNAEGLKIPIGSDAEIARYQPLFLLKKSLKLPDKLPVIMGILGNFVLPHERKYAIGKASLFHRKATGGAHFAHAGNLLEAVEQASKENGIAAFSLPVVPWNPGERNIHGDDLVHAETGVDLPPTEQRRTSGGNTAAPPTSVQEETR